MKKLLSIILMMCLLTGCSLPKPPENRVTVPSTQAATEAPTEPPTDLFDGSTPVAPNLPVYELCNDSIASLASLDQIGVFEDCLMLMGTLGAAPGPNDTEPFTVRLVLIDLQTGKLRASRDFTVTDLPGVQAGKKRITLADWASGQVTVMDSSLHTVVERQEKDSDWNLNYTDGEGNYLYHFPSSGEIVKINLSTGSETVLLDHSEEVSVVGNHSSGLALTCVDPENLQFHNFYLDFESGQLQEMPLPGRFASADCIDGLWLAQADSYHGIYLLGNTDNPDFLQSEDGSFSLTEGPAPICANGYEKNGGTLTLYNTDGSFYAALPRSESMEYIGDPVWCESRNGYFLTDYHDSGDVRLLFWDPDVSQTAKPLELTPVSEKMPISGTVSQELYDRATAISQAYGVHILIADQCGTSYNGFDAAQELDESTISAGLDAVENVLRCYPDGFMEQLLYGQFTQVQINLMGSLTASNMPEDANAFTEFDAFVDHPDNRHAMVIDITHPRLEQTMYHEFSHIIDSKLDFNSWYRDVLYSDFQWCSLNPPDFEYAQDVFKMSDDYYNDGFDSYFIDTYARTYSTEDRARVMEYAMAGYDWFFDMEYHSPLREKLAYYAASIRDGFRTDGWPETMPWEIPLYGYTYTAETEEMAPAA